MRAVGILAIYGEEDVKTYYECVVEHAGCGHGFLVIFIFLNNVLRKRIAFASVEPDQKPTLQVLVLQLPPKVKKASVLLIGQLQIALAGFLGSTVQGESTQFVQAMPLAQLIAFFALNCLKEKVEIICCALNLTCLAWRF
jgi:hypothetical protein